MASLSNESKKGYRIQWRFVVRNGSRAGETVAGSLLLGRCTKAAAKAQLRATEAWEASVKLGQHVPDGLWDELRTTWLSERALQYTDQTLARARRVLALYERWRKKHKLPCKTVEQVANRKDLTAWRDYRLAHEAGRKTVANDFSTLSEFFGWCAREKYLADNPIERIARPRFTIKKEGTPLTRTQAGRWLRSIRPKSKHGACSAMTTGDVRRKRHIAVFLLNTGLRNGELCALDIDDLRVERHTRLLHVLGKGLKHRWVPLNCAALAAVRLHLRSRGAPRTGPLFATRAGARYNGKQLAGELRKSGNSCRERIQVNAHNLRHTFATWLARTVADVSLAQKILGHENVNTTLRYYVHTEDWELAGATDRLRPRQRMNARPERAPAAPPAAMPMIIKFPQKSVS
jgi:site-specific recombinase XerD